MTALFWALAAASVAYWVLMWPTQQAGVNLVPIADNQTHQHSPSQAAKALGYAPASKFSAELIVNSPFKLMGVIASSTGQGSALIATNGQPPKAFRVGQVVQDGWTLDSLTARQALLKSVNAQVTLELPASEKP